MESEIREIAFRKVVLILLMRCQSDVANKILEQEVEYLRIKLFVFFGIMITLMISTDLFTGPSASFDSLFQHKLNEFKDESQTDRAPFIGSSRIYRGINPTVFDSGLN